MIRALVLSLSLAASSAFLSPSRLLVRREAPSGVSAFVTHFEELAVPTGTIYLWFPH